METGHLSGNTGFLESVSLVLYIPVSLAFFFGALALLARKFYAGGF
jgi:hypothetical protein